MNINFNISKKKLTQYEFENSYISLVGHIENKDIIYSSLCNDLDNEKFCRLLKEEIQGFFAIIIKKDDQLYAAVDHIRSHPLFFAKDEFNFYISDSAEWVRNQVKDLEMDPIAKEEFQLAGYVTGNDTLYPNVKQLQAGEFLVFKNNGYEIKEYYSFDHLEPKYYDQKDLKDQLEDAADKAIMNLINYAKGRQIVVPLSGGYDSRLIVTLLKKFKYNNIITFTYGVNGSKEATYSKLVADSLGLDWYFIEYSESIWNEWAQDEDNIEYQSYCSNLSSIPHLQDCIAVKKLKNKGILNDNAIFVPGHSGDMLAGSHIPDYIHENYKKIYSKDNLIKHLFEKHYSLKKKSDIQAGEYMKKISEIIGSKDYYDAYEFSNQCEKFNWKNRQSKFICNSVRLYEFYNYSWWMPLWDKEMVKFFEELPLELRNHKWYVSYVFDLFEKESNIRNMKNSNEHSYFFNLVKKIVTKLSFLNNIVKNIYEKLFFVDQMGWYGQFPNFKIMKKKGYTYNGLVAYFFIKKLDDRKNRN